MRLFVFLLCLFLTISLVRAETWSCSYMWKGDNKNWVIKREGNIFVKPVSGAIETIVEETNEFVHLYSRIKPFNTYFATYLDKIGQRFSMVGLQPGSDTNIISGKCVIF